MEHWLSMMDSMVDRSMDKRSGMVDWTMDKRSCMVEKRSMVGSWSIRLWLWHIWLGFSFILDISNKTTLMVSMVGDYLDTTIRKLHTVLTCKYKCYKYF